jgi:hypothetical protein
MDVPSSPELEEVAGLDLEQAALNCGGTAEPPQQASQSQNEFSCLAREGRGSFRYAPPSSGGGGLLLLIYALYRRDPVFIVGQAFGLLVYVRNLYFIKINVRQQSLQLPQ